MPHYRKPFQGLFGGKGFNPLSLVGHELKSSMKKVRIDSACRGCLEKCLT